MTTKTPDYTRRAIDNYNARFDRITVNFPKGTKEKIKELTGESAGGFAVKCVIEELERIENGQAATPAAFAQDQERTAAESQGITPPTAAAFMPEPMTDQEEPPLAEVVERLKAKARQCKENNARLREEENNNE